MKKMMWVSIIITAFMLLMPLSAMGKAEKEEKIIAVSGKVEVDKNAQDIFRVFDSKSQTVTEMKAEDYIFGVVAAEMPALYESEALKAQAVAAYTYACYKRLENSDKDYDITTDFSKDQSFKTEEKALSDWGEKGQEYADKIKTAVNETRGEYICYKNKPILAVYHAVSCGQTYSAADVWGNKIDYLQSASSKGDKLANNYTNAFEFTEAALKEKFSSFKSSEAPIISDLKTKNSGLVESVKIWGEKISGNEVRALLDLSSANFTFEKKDDKYIFTCLGYGHGVGMSQKGADHLAKQGYNYKQILMHYYANTTISS